MTALLLAFLAACCATLSNLFLRINAVQSKTQGGEGYLLLFYLSAFIFSVARPDLWSTKINFIILGLGCTVGFLNITMMATLSRALQYGPSGLTFAFQNSSAVFPALLLFLLFGTNFGFQCSFLQWVGIFFVLIGLFLGSMRKQTDVSKISYRWLKYSFAAFFFQVLALTFIQGRCLLFKCENFNILEIQDVWFMPGLFGTALLMQAIIFLRKGKKLQKNELIYGTFGGLANLASTILLLMATQTALPFEQGILFPSFAVATILLCNLWANRIYKENFNFMTNCMCSLGILLGVLGS